MSAPDPPPLAVAAAASSSSSSSSSAAAFPSSVGAASSSSSVIPSLHNSGVSSLGEISQEEWDRMEPIEQLLSTAVKPDEVVAYLHDNYGECVELVDEFAGKDLVSLCKKMGIKAVGGRGGAKKMREAIVKAVEDFHVSSAKKAKKSSAAVVAAATPPLASAAAATAPASASLPPPDVLSDLGRLSGGPSVSFSKGTAAASANRKKRPVEVDSDSDLSGGDSSDSSSSSSSDSDPDASASASASDPVAAFTSRRASSRKLDQEMDKHGLGKPVAKRFIRNVMASAGHRGSVYKVYKYDVVFRKERNRRECISLAKMLDAVIRKQWKVLRELLVRRLAGVQSADKSDNWDICDVIELDMEKQSFVPDSFMQRALKSVMRVQAMEKSGKSAKPFGGGGGGGGTKFSDRSGGSSSGRSGGQSGDNKKKSPDGSSKKAGQGGASDR
jgi:hypothetical protein